MPNIRRRLSQKQLVVERQIRERWWSVLELFEPKRKSGTDFGDDTNPFPHSRSPLRCASLRAKDCRRNRATPRMAFRCLIDANPGRNESGQGDRESLRRDRGAAGLAKRSSV